MTNAPSSPDGRYRFDLDTWEARASLWVESPRLVNTETKTSAFDLWNTPWSLDGAQWQGAERVTLLLRRFPGDHAPSVFAVVVRPRENRATIEGVSFSLDALLEGLESLYRRHQTKVGG